MCVKVSGRCVISGHTDGDVFLWNSNDSVKVASHMTAVTSLGTMVYSGEFSNFHSGEWFTFTYSGFYPCSLEYFGSEKAFFSHCLFIVPD